MVIDMTAQFAPLIIGTEVALLIAASAVLLSVWRVNREYDATASDVQRDVAIVGISPSAPAPADDAPGDTSVREAA